MFDSLRCVDLACQPCVDVPFFAGLPSRMARDEDDRKALGARLGAARKLAGLTQEHVAAKLTELGFETGKAAVSAWENGRNVPDSLVLRRLAKLYEATADALLWDTAITMEAIRFAAQYDALSDRQRRTFKAMWLAYFEEAKSDAEVEEHLPAVSETEAADRRVKQAPYDKEKRGRTFVYEGGITSKLDVGAVTKLRRKRRTS